jgi:hypothetical protein
MNIMIPTLRESNMNKTEAAYAWILEAEKRAGEIIDWKFEPFGLRLADKTFYHPDFIVVKKDGFEIHETKGAFIREDAIVKLKIAAEQFPWWRFKMAQYKDKQWKIKGI